MQVWDLLAAGAVGTVLSGVLCGIFVKFSRWSGFGLDGLHGVHKFHAHETPRIGGLPVLLALLLVSPLIAGSQTFSTTQWLALIGAATLICGVGLIEDLTGRVGVAARTIVTAFGAALPSIVAGITLTRVDLPLAESWLIQSQWIGVAFTVIAVLGFTHSVNLIDGYNGLLGFCSLIGFAALAAVAWRVGDTAVLGLAVSVVGVVFGFLLWNFPGGRIFLGDSGAYLLGFLQAEASILLLSRNPEVSQWCMLLLGIYPVTETFFSIYRKRVLRRRSPWTPDRLHFHMLIFQRLVRIGLRARTRENRLRRNSMTSPYLALCAVFCAVPAVLLWNDTGWLMLCCGLFVLCYTSMYWRLVRFRAPRFLVMREAAAPQNAGAVFEDPAAG